MARSSHSKAKCHSRHLLLSFLISVSSFNFAQRQLLRARQRYLVPQHCVGNDNYLSLMLTHFPSLAISRVFF